MYQSANNSIYKARIGYPTINGCIPDKELQPWCCANHMHPCCSLFLCPSYSCAATRTPCKMLDYINILGAQDHNSGISLCTYRPLQFMTLSPLTVLHHCKLFIVLVIFQAMHKAVVSASNVLLSGASQQIVVAVWTSKSLEVSHAIAHCLLTPLLSV